jgi:hypothetical protein
VSVSQGLRLPPQTTVTSTPDNAKYTPATSLEVRWWGTADDWTPAATLVMAHQSGFIADVAWAIQITTAGQVSFSWSPDGTVGATQTRTATVTPAAINRFPHGYGARLVLATRTVTFLHSPDGITWIPFETSTPGAATTVFNSTQALGVGGAGTAVWTGNCRWFELRIDGRIVADPAFEEQLAGTTTFDDSRGNKWTLGTTSFIQAHLSFAPTAADILDLNGVHRRKDGFRFELCDRELRPIGEVHPDRAGSVPTIENDTSNNTARRLRNLRLLPDEAADIDVIRDRLRVYMVLQNGDEYRLGTFLWGDENRPLRSWGEQHDGDLTDFTYVLDQQVTQAFGWGKGANIALSVVFLMLRAGFSVEDFSPLNEDPGRTLADPKAWQPGVTWRTMIDELADLVGFASPWFDRDGLFHFQSAPNPDIDPPTVPAYEDGTRIVADSILYSGGLVTAANDFAVTDSGTDRLRIGRFQVPASARHSFANRGYRVGKVESAQGGESQAQLNQAALKLARSQGQAIEVLQFTSTADPRHDTFDVVPALGETWLERAWRLECRSGGPHTHTLERATYAVG